MTPTKRTPEVEAEILRRLSSGEPLTWICRDEGMPSATTWREWCRADEGLDIAHARARNDGFDAIAEQCIEIAEDGTNDYVDRVRDGKVEKTFDAEHVQRSKLRVETRLKLLAKWDPKRYGDKLQTEHSGSMTVVSATPTDEAI